MKTPFKTLATAATLALLSLGALPSQAADQYEISKTLLSIATTNNPDATTNVAAINGGTNFVTLTKFGDFALVVDVGVTNAVTGTIDLSWQTSPDGVNWATAGSSAVGWFSAPLTNGGTHPVWLTNITVNSVGYWRVNWATNKSGQHLTNWTIRTYTKPKRNG